MVCNLQSNLIKCVRTQIFRSKPNNIPLFSFSTLHLRKITTHAPQHTYLQTHTFFWVKDKALAECYRYFFPFESGIKCISWTHVRSHWLRLQNQTHCLWHRAWIAYEAGKIVKAQALMTITTDKAFWSQQICGKYEPEYALVKSKPAEEVILMEDHIQRSVRLHNICKYKNKVW